MKRISTNDNCADSLTKQTGRQLFYRHFDYILGKTIPEYVKCVDKQQQQMYTVKSLHDTNSNTNNTLMELYLSHIIDDTPSILKLCSFEHAGGIVCLAIIGLLNSPIT